MWISVETVGKSDLFFSQLVGNFLKLNVDK